MLRTASPPQRRRFSRVLFKASAQLKVGQQILPCRVGDLSLKGALVEIAPPSSVPAIGTSCALELQLDGNLHTIHMDAQVAHHQGRWLGIACQSIDLDSITHLRRLIELNLGDADLLQRELSALADEAA